MAKAANLVSIPTLVQSPFIIANIGGVTFGTFSGNYRTNATYPNYMESMSVTKVNGTGNTYTVNFHDQVATGQDPNLLDKIFSRATKDRRIILQYGDWMAPNYIYKEDQCIITNVTTRLNMSSSSLDYTLQCTSDAIGLNSTQFNFPARNAKPSDVILQLLSNSKYGLKDVFTGMRNKNVVLSKNLIASNDKKVQLLPQNNTTILNYLNYLVGCMVDNKTPEENKLSTYKYFLTINDHDNNDIGES